MILTRRLLPPVQFLLTVAMTFLGLLAITFVIGRVVPIDPVIAVVGDRASKETYEATRLAMGLDDPLIVQFARYVGAVVQGNLGNSISTGRAVVDDLARVFPATLEMATLGILIGVLLGVPMGVWAAARQGSWLDQVIRVVGLAGYAIPAFWLGLVGLVLFYAKLRWAGDLDSFRSALSHIVLPASILGFFSGSVAHLVQLIHQDATFWQSLKEVADGVMVFATRFSASRA